MNTTLDHKRIRLHWPDSLRGLVLIFQSWVHEIDAQGDNSSTESKSSIP